MGEPQRRRTGRAATGEPVSIEEAAGEIAGYLLADSCDRAILLGPVVWAPSDGTAARRWAFIAATGGRKGEMRPDRIGAGSEDDTVALRAALIIALVDRRPCVAVDFDSELALARAAETQSGRDDPAGPRLNGSRTARVGP
jgi:hypothetical protein